MICSQLLCFMLRYFAFDFCEKTKINLLLSLIVRATKQNLNQPRMKERRLGGINPTLVIAVVGKTREQLSETCTLMSSIFC